MRFFARFGPYPYTFLLFVAWLEAIILSVMILISQNMSAEASERRRDLGLQINLLNEREMTAMLRLAMQIADRVGVDPPIWRSRMPSRHTPNPSKCCTRLSKPSKLVYRKWPRPHRARPRR